MTSTRSRPRFPIAGRPTRSAPRRDPALIEEFIDFYNGAGAFARWPQECRDGFLAVQQARGDLWDVLCDDRLLQPANEGCQLMTGSERL